MSELQEMVKKAKSGDNVAIEFIVNYYEQSLIRYCFFLCHDLNLAQDLSQDAFVHSIEGISKLKNEDSFKSWLFRIAKNLYLDRIKLRDNNNSSLETISIDQLPMAHEADLDEVHHVLTILQSMKLIDRMVLLLIDLDQFTYKETSIILGVSESAVRSRLHRAKQEFIDKYGNEFDPSIVLLK